MSLAFQTQSIVETLPELRQAVRQYREIILASSVMMGEIPAPTHGEEERMRFLSDRFTECGLQNISIDEAGNATAVLHGHGGDGCGKKNILLEAHVDTVFDRSVDHSVTLGTDVLAGPGIADNSIGAAVISILPLLLENLGIRFSNNLILLGAVQSQGRGDLGGFRFFLNNVQMPIHAGVCLAGIHLGRLSYTCLGMLRGEIVCRTPPETFWERSNAAGAIVTLNSILTRILAITELDEPGTSLILGSIKAGNAFNTVPSQALLRFELRSKVRGKITIIHRKIKEILHATNENSAARADLHIITRRKPGGMRKYHPMVEGARAILNALGIEPKIAPSVGALSALIAKKIPGITLGITSGQHLHEFDEQIHIEPIFTGIAQLIGVLQMIDQGIGHED